VHLNAVQTLSGTELGSGGEDALAPDDLVLRGLASAILATVPPVLARRFRRTAPPE
jgi:hypothetical protein